MIRSIDSYRTSVSHRVATPWPRVAGHLLVTASVGFVVLFGWWKIGAQGLINQAVTIVLFLGPILVSGVALLTSRQQAEN